MDKTESEAAKPTRRGFAPLERCARALQQLDIGRWTGQVTALSFYSILGVVPFLALCFAIAKSFGLEQALVTALNDFFATFDGQDKALERIQGFADNVIGNYSGSVMVFSSIGLIFWSGFQILQLLDTALSSNFGYLPRRRITHRVLDYFCAMVILPMVIVLTAAINIFLTGLSKESWSIPLSINPDHILSTLVVVTPHIMWWLVLTWAYMYFSRGLARWPACLVSGLISSLLFQVFQGVYISAMIVLTRYNAIYGSFAAIPLFMIWLYGSWFIVLAGGEMTRRFEDRFSSGIRFFHPLPPESWRDAVQLSQAVMDEVVRNFTAGPDGGATSFRALSKSTRAPMPRLGGALTRLISVNLLIRVMDSDCLAGPAFLPAYSPDQLTQDFIRGKLEEGSLCDE